MRTAEQYFDELNTVLRKHYDDHSRFNLSLADASIDLWLDGYKPGVPDRKVSVYHKGALVALLLDLTIRRLSHHQRSLDDVMRRLWQEFGKVNVGYTEQDYMQLVSEVAGKPMQRYFDQFVYGTAPLEEPLNKVLHFVGCQLCIQENPSVAESLFGFRAVTKNERTEVAAILPGSPAAAALTIDDEIVAVNGRRVAMNLQCRFANSDEKPELSVVRHNRLLTVTLTAKPDQRFSQNITIEKLSDATPEQQASFKQWLKQVF